MSLGVTVSGSDERPPRPTSLDVDDSISVAALAVALAKYGMTIKATTDGRSRITMAWLTRDDMLTLNAANCVDSMRFTPHNGRCTYCGEDLIAQYGIAAICAGMNVTGCRRCHRSYAD